MIKIIKIERFRCFKEASFTLKDLVILVGSNNSGKTSVIEAIRIIATACKRLKTNNYIEQPEWISGKATRGINFSIDHLKIDLKTVLYYYENDYAVLTVYFDNDLSVKVFINSDSVFAVLYKKKVNIINKKDALKVIIPIVNIMPPLGLIKDDEAIIDPKVIKRDLDTYLSFRHFRNELYYFKEKFDDFKQLAESTWSKLVIKDLSLNNSYISLIVEDNRFPAELGLMGSGMQIWLQVVWFICKSFNNDIIVLDEPDVYMHPDLQRQVLRIVKKGTNRSLLRHIQ